MMPQNSHPECCDHLDFSETCCKKSMMMLTSRLALGDDDRESNTLESIRALLAQNITVALYAGDADYNCNWLGGEAVASEIAAPGYASAGYTNLITSDGITHGQVKQAGKFSFTRVYYSGHEVPFYQPLASLEMFERFIGGRDVATGRVGRVGGGFKTVGTPTSTFREVGFFLFCGSRVEFRRRAVWIRACCVGDRDALAAVASSLDRLMKRNWDFRTSC